MLNHGRSTEETSELILLPSLSAWPEKQNGGSRCLGFWHESWVWPFSVKQVRTISQYSGCFFKGISWKCINSPKDLDLNSPNL